MINQCFFTRLLASKTVTSTVAPTCFLAWTLAIMQSGPKANPKKKKQQ